MPHQCTNCGRSFEDGSKEMLSGCPDCGGNKFQFDPDGASGGTVSDQSPATHDVDDGPGGAPDPDDSPGGVSTSEDDPLEADDSDIIEAGAESLEDEADAQQHARSSLVDSDQLSAARKKREAAEAERLDEVDSEPSGSGSASPDADDPAESAATPSTSGDASAFDPPAGADPDQEVLPEEDRPDLEELRDELNQQFESIRIVAPGQYELNLMELYDRQEYIISLQEDGKYVIEVPDRWDDE